MRSLKNDLQYMLFKIVKYIKLINEYLIKLHLLWLVFFLLFLGCHKKMPQTGWLKQWKLLSHILEARKNQDQVQDQGGRQQDRFY